MAASLAGNDPAARDGVRGRIDKGRTGGLAGFSLSAFGILMLAWVALAVGGIAVTYKVLAIADRGAIDSAIVGSRATADAIRQKVYRLLDTVETLQRLASLRAYHVRNADSTGRSLAEDTITEFVARNRYGMIQLAIIQPDGMLGWSTVPGWQPVNLSDREHFRAHAGDQLDGLFVSVPLLGRASNRWSIQFTRALRDENGEFRGVVVISVDPAWLEDEISRSLSNPSDVAVLLRQPGAIILVHVPPVAGRVGTTSPAEARIQDVLQGRSATPTFFLTIREFNFAITVADIAPDRLALAYGVNVTTILEDRAIIRRTAWTMLGLVLLMILLMMLAFTSWGARNREKEKVQAVDGAISPLPIAVYRAILAPDGASEILYASPNLGRIVGYAALPEDDAHRWDWRARSGPVGRQRIKEFLTDLRTRGSAETEYRLQSADDQARLIRETANVLCDLPGGAMEVSGYVTDVSEIRRVERLAADATKLATLGEMAAGVAHELNQPLTTALLAAENANYDLDENNPDAARRRLARIVESIARTTSITENLCRFARGEGQEPPTAVDVASALRGALLLTGGALRAERVELRQDLPPDLPFALARPIELEQVLVNLFVNARDAFLSRPPEERRIEVAARADNEAVVITIRDNAGGIPPHAIGRIFEPFFTTKEPGKGTGLGLPICRRMIEEVGGTITVASGDGDTIFTIWLPVSSAGVSGQSVARLEE